MRPIDADELLTAFPVDDEPTLTKSCVRMTIQHMPSVDAVPVVRCRNCRFSQRINEWVYECYVWNDDRMFNQYCDMGERKDGDHETD